MLNRVVVSSALILCACGVPLPLSAWKSGGLHCQAFDPDLDITTPRIVCALSLPNDAVKCPTAQSMTTSATTGMVFFQTGGGDDCDAPAVVISEFDNEVTLTDGVTTASFRIGAAPDIALKANPTSSSVTRRETIDVRRADDAAFEVPTITTDAWEYAGGDVRSDVIPVEPAFDTGPGSHRFSVQHRVTGPAPQSTFFKQHDMELWTLSSIELTVWP